MDTSLYTPTTINESVALHRADDPDLGHVMMQIVVPKMSLTPGTIRFPGHSQIDADRQEI